MSSHWLCSQSRLATSLRTLACFSGLVQNFIVNCRVQTGWIPCFPCFLSIIQTNAGNRRKFLNDLCQLRLHSVLCLDLVFQLSRPVLGTSISSLLIPLPQKNEIQTDNIAKTRKSGSPPERVVGELAMPGGLSCPQGFTYFLVPRTKQKTQCSF